LAPTTALGGGPIPPGGGGIPAKHTRHTGQVQDGVKPGDTPLTPHSTAEPGGIPLTPQRTVNGSQQQGTWTQRTVQRQPTAGKRGRNEQSNDSTGWVDTSQQREPPRGTDARKRPPRPQQPLPAQPALCLWHVPDPGGPGGLAPAAAAGGGGPMPPGGGGIPAEHTRENIAKKEAAARLRQEMPLAAGSRAQTRRCGRVRGGVAGNTEPRPSQHIGARSGRLERADADRLRRRQQAAGADWNQAALGCDTAPQALVCCWQRGTVP
jgi:hypothetical protein